MCMGLVTGMGLPVGLGRSSVRSMLEDTPTEGDSPSTCMDCTRCTKHTQTNVTKVLIVPTFNFNKSSGSENWQIGTKQNP